MIRPESLVVDRDAGLVRWRGNGNVVEAAAPGAFDARWDPASGRVLVLAREEDEIAVVLLSPGGDPLGIAQPPDGYSPSHFADSGPEIVCQGRDQDGAWWDWHFTVDAGSGTLRKAGPAY